MKEKARLAIDKHWYSDISYPGVGEEGWSRSYIWVTPDGGHWDFGAASRYDGKYIHLKRYPGNKWDFKALGTITYVKKSTKEINKLIKRYKKIDPYYNGDVSKDPINWAK
jgi:hypothetical protein